MTSHVVEEQIKEFDKQFCYWVVTGSTLNDGSELRLKTERPEGIKAFIRSFASTLIERVGSELIGEDDLGLAGTRYHHRDELRAEQRTKLQEMKG